jgi:hypothetical protein
MAVAAGGASALTACLQMETDAETPSQDLADVPAGPTDLSTVPERQHAWVDFLVFDRFSNTVLPQHHALLMLEYVGDEPPTASDRDRVEGALRTLERAFVRGTAGNSNAVHHDGLLFTIGYSPAYFERFDADLPAALDLPTAGELLDRLDEDASRADDYDAAVHLASGYASVLLAAETMLFEGLDRINGVDVEGTFEGIFERVERRTGFIGRGEPAKRYDEESVPESAPLSMGFKSGFRDNLPREDRVTIPDGPFAEGTTQMISRIDIDLDRWYGERRTDRVRQMFSPHHAPEDVGDVGEDLAAHSRTTADVADRVPEDARERGLLGHGQKTARARTDDFEPRILRRDFNRTGDPGMHFNSWQRGLADFVKTRQAMNASEHAAEVAPEHNGILDYIDVTSRATFLMPPRSLRSLPSPRPGR